MPEVVRRTPETEKAQEYSIPDLIVELAKKVVEDTKKGFKKRKFTDAEFIDIALSGVGAGTKILKGIGKGQFPFNVKTTDLPFWDAALKKPAYFKKVKGVTRRIKFMSPDEYFRRINKGRRQDPLYDDLKDFAQYANPKLVDKYTVAMRHGSAFPMPGLEYQVTKARPMESLPMTVRVSQEGRHRALAAKKLGIDRMPVLLLQYKIR